MRRIPAAVWALGFVSLFMDVSSEMVHSLLPLFLVSVLGASPLRLGIIEGIAESTAVISKIFSGPLSDFLGKRKALALIGYGMGVLAKPLYGFAATPLAVFGARMIDRLGKGIRGAPRDAMVADASPPEIRGAAFGLRQSLDTVGSLLGPAAAMILMRVFAGDFRRVFWWSAAPGLLSVAVLLLAVREKPHAAVRARSPLRAAEIARLGPRFWGVTVFGALLSLARFSEAFLILRAQETGLSPADAPAVMMAMNIAYFLTAYPAGYLSDRIGRGGLLGAGLAALVASDLVLAGARAPWEACLGAALWGLQMGLTQGLLAALVADSAPADLRGTAFGLFNLAGGTATLLAGLLAGAVWRAHGGPACYLAGAVLATAAGVTYVLRKRR